MYELPPITWVSFRSSKSSMSLSLRSLQRPLPLPEPFAEARVVADRGQLAGGGVADQAGADGVVDAAGGQVRGAELGAPRTDRAALEAAQPCRAETAQEVTLGQRQRDVVVDLVEVAELMQLDGSAQAVDDWTPVSKSSIELNGMA